MPTFTCQMAKPEHVDEGMDVGLRGEVDAGAHMAQGGVDVCGIGGAKAMNGLFVHFGLGILSILGGVFSPHQTCRFQSKSPKVEQSQLAIGFFPGRFPECSDAESCSQSSIMSSGTH